MQEVKWKSRFNYLAIFTALFFVGCVCLTLMCMDSSDEYINLTRSYEDLGYEYKDVLKENETLKTQVEELKQELSEKPQ